MSADCPCSRPITDTAAICRTCTDRLRQTLAEVPSWHQRLEVTRTRQSKTGGRGIGVISRNADRPLPWDERASRAAQHLRAEMVGTVRVLVEDHPGPLPIDTVPAMSTWLLGRVEQWRRHEDAYELLEALTDALAAVAGVCDREPDRVYLGVCSSWKSGVECPADVYAEQDALLAYCRESDCKEEHVVVKRREVLLAAVQDQVVDLRTLSAALSSLAEPVTTDALRRMIGRAITKGHLFERPMIAGVAVYRVGDVVALLAKRRPKREDAA